MSAEDNKALVRRLVEEAINRRNLAVIDQLMTPGYVEHNAPPGTGPGLEGVKQGMATYLAAFPELHVTIEDQVAAGDRVAGRYTTRVTHGGDLFGIPPTGRSAVYQTFDIVRIEDGRIAERWSVDDMLGLMRQLGLVPAPGPNGG